MLKEFIHISFFIAVVTPLTIFDLYIGSGTVLEYPAVASAIDVAIERSKQTGLPFNISRQTIRVGGDLDCYEQFILTHEILGDLISEINRSSGLNILTSNGKIRIRK